MKYTQKQIDKILRDLQFESNEKEWNRKIALIKQLQKGAKQ